MNNDVEESEDLQIDFKKLRQIASLNLDVIPAVAQEITTKEVLIVGYVNKIALDHTQKTGNATFWSTSRNELWEKGVTSGSTLKVQEIRVNCEQNSILYLVSSKKGACHTRNKEGYFRNSCYYRRLDRNKLEFLDEVT